MVFTQAGSCMELQPLDRINGIAHLAIPCHDLDAAHHFYVEQLACPPARRYEDRITLNFFGHQLVCHLAPDAIDAAPRMYPRHFGFTFRERADFDALLDMAHKSAIPFYHEPFVRFAGRQEDHWTFFLQDPSNNLLEFKHYPDSGMMY